MTKSQIFIMENMSFNAICENKILAKISEFTVVFIGIQHRVQLCMWYSEKSTLSADPHSLIRDLVFCLK